jgi:hypothetical protein
VGRSDTDGTRYIYRWIVGNKGALSERAELYSSKGILVGNAVA